MATETEAIRRTVTLEIRSVSEAGGRNGPQWQLEFDVPWSDYPMRGWLDQSEHPTQPSLGPTRGLLQRGRLLDGKSGDSGAPEYNWRWRLLEINVGDVKRPADESPRDYEEEEEVLTHGGPEAEEPPTVRPSPPLTPVSGYQDRQVRIEWQAARHDAVALFGPIPDGATFQQAEPMILDWTARIYEYWWPGVTPPTEDEAETEPAEKEDDWSKE